MRRRILLAGFVGCVAGGILLIVFIGRFGGVGPGLAAIGRHFALPGLLQGDPRAVLPVDPSYEIVRLQTKDGTRIVGQFGKAEAQTGEPAHDSTHAPTVIFFYGVSQHLSAPADQNVFNGLRAMGVNVFIPEFPGYGMSEGTPGERQCYATADAAFDYLQGRSDIDHTRIIAAGRSLGAGTALDLASRRRLAGVISVGGFTNVADVLADTSWIPRWLANAMAAECRFDNLAKIRSVPCPILLVYGRQDTVVSPWMADRLASAATAPVTKISVFCDHNSLWKSDHCGLNGNVRDWILAR
jgi:dienelactone hydrolase